MPALCFVGEGTTPTPPYFVSKVREIRHLAREGTPGT
jgi:hypothetical protein